MSRDLIIRVIDNTTQEELRLFNSKDEDITWRIFDNGPMSLLCPLMTGEDESFEDYYRGLPPNCPEDLAKEYEDISSVTYYDYCELAALARTPEANLCDWHAMEEADWKPGQPKITYNPMPDFMAKVRLICDAYEKYFIKPGEIYIICEVSY